MNLRTKPKTVVTKGSIEVVAAPVKPKKVSKAVAIPNLDELKNKSAAELTNIAEKLGMENLARYHKKDMIFALLKERAKQGEEISGSGVLEILPDGFGFLRSPEASYVAGADDIYLSPSQIRRFDLHTGNLVAGKIRPPKEGERYFALRQVDTVNGEDPLKNYSPFVNLRPVYATDRLVLERGDGSSEDLTGRVIDLAAPLGKGQRGLIVSPPKAGKTMMLQSIARSIAHNHPECHLIVLLVGERPEEVTDMQRSVKGEVIASTFDQPATRHIQVAEMVIERAKRLVEHKKDVVILMDSITRLARAYNTVMPSSGKVLTGGIDANALQPPKQFFGAARNVEEGGSLSIFATVLHETGSKMDDVIYEEFKGTGNLEIPLYRGSAELRIFPAINFKRAGARHEELLLPADQLQKIWILRKILHSMDEIGSMEFLLDRLRATKTNAEFFDAMNK